MGLFKNCLYFMKHLILITFLTSSLLIGCSNGQTNNNYSTSVTKQKTTIDNFQFSFESAHPKAQALMKDEFYWSPIEETAPFGSDDGSDAAYGFRQWRLLNKNISPVVYLKELIERWQYPFFDYNELDTTKIREYISRKPNLDEKDMQQQINTLREALKNSGDTSINKTDDSHLREVVIASSKKMGGTYLLGQDNAIIGICFAQFVLEGHIDSDIKNIGITAIKRQLLPILLERWGENYSKTRKQKLKQLFEVISKAN